jgi:hypothetical protein
MLSRLVDISTRKRGSLRSLPLFVLGSVLSSAYRRWSRRLPTIIGGTGGCGSPPSAVMSGVAGVRAFGFGTGGCGSVPSAVVSSENPGCGAPPPTSASMVPTACAVFTIGTYGSSGLPPECNLHSRGVDEKSFVEKPRSGIDANRIEHETFLKVIVFSLLEFGPWANLRILLAGCFLSCAGR